MNRRQFLKALGITVAAAYLPIPALSAYPHFDHTKQYGDYVMLTEPLGESLDDPHLMAAKRLLEEQITFSVPEKYRDQIDWIYNMPRSAHPDPFQRVGSVAWKYTPKNYRGIDHKVVS